MASVAENAEPLSRSKTELNYYFYGGTMKIDTTKLTDEEKISLIDQLLTELKVDNFNSCMDRPNRRNYKGLIRQGEEIGIVMIEPYGK